MSGEAEYPIGLILVAMACATLMVIPQSRKTLGLAFQSAMDVAAEYNAVYTDDPNDD